MLDELVSNKYVIAVTFTIIGIVIKKYLPEILPDGKIVGKRLGQIISFMFEMALIYFLPIYLIYLSNWNYETDVIPQSGNVLALILGLIILFFCIGGHFFHYYSKRNNKRLNKIEKDLSILNGTDLETARNNLNQTIENMTEKASEDLKELDKLKEKREASNN